MKKILTLLFLMSAFSGAAYAAFGALDAGSLNQEYVRDMRLHDFERRSQNKSAIIQKEKETEEMEEPKINHPSTVPVVNNIRFSGNSQIPAGDLSRLVSNYIGQIPTDSSIAQMRKTITQYYQANGYYSVIVIPDLSGLSQGLLTFEIKEGMKNSITIE